MIYDDDNISGHRKTIGKEPNQRILGKETWRKNVDSRIQVYTAGGRWRRQHKTELD